jgi:hypothetical protein
MGRGFLYPISPLPKNRDGLLLILMAHQKRLFATWRGFGMVNPKEASRLAAQARWVQKKSIGPFVGAPQSFAHLLGSEDR